MKTVLLHLERLRRHYEVAVRTYDQVSLLDLSHSLRVWAELKQPLKTIAPGFSKSISFKTATPAKKAFAAARGHKYVFSYMPGGVKTFASNGQLVSGPEDASGPTDLTMMVSMKSTPPLVELGNYCVVSAVFDESTFKALSGERVKRCTYAEWLGAEAVRVSYINAHGALEVVAISREMIVRRVANTLDGSHPSAAGGGEVDNTFDAPIHHLLQYKMGGLPLPYFILLKIAQDILEISAKHMAPHDVTKSS